MGRGRKPSKELNYRDKKIVQRFNSTSDKMPQIAKKYGITKQRIHEILKRAKKLGYVVNRPKLLMRYHWVDRCEVCSKILKVAKEDELVTRRQLAQMLKTNYQICNGHLSWLKKEGFISKKFATIRSDRLSEALKCYKSNTLSPSAVGKRFGYKNFYSILQYQKQKGINLDRRNSRMVAETEIG